jgi:hypothetical protein
MTTVLVTVGWGFGFGSVMSSMVFVIVQSVQIEYRWRYLLAYGNLLSIVTLSFLCF